jgi:hypothetical protein
LVRFYGLVESYLFLRRKFAVGVFLRGVLCNMSSNYSKVRNNYVTQSTHSTIVNYQRRNKYFILSPDFETSKKYINHGQAERWARRQAMGSSRWVGRCRCRRICLFSLNRRRKKYFIDGIYFNLFFISSESIDSKTINYRPPCVPQRLRVLFYPSPVTPSCFWLVVACCLSPGGNARPRRILFFCHGFPLHVPPIKHPLYLYRQSRIYLIVVYVFGETKVTYGRARPSLSQFLSINSTADWRVNAMIPHAFRPSTSSHRRIPHRVHHRLFDCCFEP